MSASPSRPSITTDVAVIGAGIIGINSALAIAKDGTRVVVIDRLDPGEGCSFGNAGLFSPWSFVPIFGPEVLPSVPRYLLDPLAPLTIRWTHLPQLLPWLCRMLLKANTAHLRHAAEAMQNLTIGSGEAYAQLAREAGTPELVRQETILQVYSSEQDFKKADKDFAYRATFGIRYDGLDRKELHDLEPAVGETFRWAHALHGGARTTNPDRLVKALARSLVKRGGAIEKADVRKLEHDRADTNCPFTLHTGAGLIKARQVVIAAGAFSHQLARQVGDRIPLGTERGYHAVIAKPGVEVKHAVGWKMRGFFAAPMEMGLRLAGTVELAGLEAPPNYERADRIAELADILLPGVNTGVTSRWMGFRPTLPDSMPVIGPSNAAPGLFYAFGHQHIGMVCAPATGRIIAGLIGSVRPNFDLEPFSAYRF